MIDEPVNEYLWDRRGDPDPDVQHFERLLARYRFDPPVRAVTRTPLVRWIWRGAAVAAAAAVVFAAYVASIPVFGQPGREWRVVARAGRPTVSGAAIVSSGLLAAGGDVETDANSSAEIRAGRVGRIVVEPDSRVRLISTGADGHRLALDRGRISARLWSPPFTFGFATPAADAFDVGCAFAMDVDDRGAATVRVTSGWVLLETPARQQLIPEGALAIAERGLPIGTPFFDDATPAFKQALHVFDAGMMTAGERRGVLATILADARPRDVYTLLRLNHDLTPEERGTLYDRAAALRTPPAAVTRDGIVANDDLMIDAWRRTLGLPEVKRWWVHWADIIR